MQTYGNWELIIIIDGCMDHTANICKEKFQHPHIVTIENDKGVGGAQARNMGIDRAQGDYIAFLDDDDTWLPEKCSQQVNFLESHPNYSMLSCGFFLHQGRRSTIISSERRHKNYGDLLSQNGMGSYSFCMVRKSHLKDLRIDPTLRSAQDWDLWLKIAKANPNHCWGSLSTPLANYFQHEGDRISSNARKASRSMAKVIRKHWKAMSPPQKTHAILMLRTKMRQYKHASIWGITKDLALYLFKSEHKNISGILDLGGPLKHRLGFKEKKAER